MTVRDVLKKHQLFHQLSRKSLSLLEVKAKIVNFEPGEMIITSGYRGRYFGILIEGQLEALNRQHDKIGEINKGEYLGEMSLLTGEPSTADVRSVKASRVFLIPHHVVSRVLPGNPDMIKQLSATMRIRLAKRESSIKEKEALSIARGSLPGPKKVLATRDATVKKIMVINCRDAALKWDYYDIGNANQILGGQLENIGFDHTVHIIETGLRGSVQIERGLHKADHTAALQDILNFLTGPKGPLNSLQDLDAVGHKVVHGGESFASPVVIDDNVLEDIRELSSLPPGQNATALKGLKAGLKLLPEVRHVAVFDTAFHQAMPAYAYLYGLPRKFYEEKRIRRYGFQGISHHYAALEAAAFVKKPLDKLKVITCHLGKETSICAIEHGRSIDTSMGFTPSEGPVMGTRSGDIEPGILVHLARSHGFGMDEIDRLLKEESGLAGLSGISDDINEIKEAAARGNQEALMAMRVFCYRVKKYIGAYIGILNGLDVLVFTGSIGIGSAGVRARVCQGLDRLGVMLDELKNRTIEEPENPEEISDASSSLKILVIPPAEEKMLAYETIRALKRKEALDIVSMPTKRQKKIPITILYRHAHLNKEARDILFGKDCKLTPDERLSQTGQVIFKERLNLIGPRRKIENVRIQGPLRAECQVEIARTEQFILGIDAPVRESGNLSGTPGITLEGPCGQAHLKQGVINTQRHIRMDPEDALLFGIRDGDRVMFTVVGERPLIFADVLIKISSRHKLEMQIDTDDANAAGIEAGMTGKITGIVSRRAE